MTLWIGSASGTDDIPYFGGEYSSFLVGQRMLGVQTYIPVTTEDDPQPIEYDEVARLFDRMNGGELDQSAGIDTSQYLMTNGGTYFAPLSGIYRTVDGNVPMMSYLVVYSDGSEDTFSQGSYIRTIDEPNGKPITELEVGDRPLSNRGVSVKSIDPIVDGSSEAGISYTRASFDWDYSHGQERFYSAGSENAASIGLSFRVYQNNSDRGYAFFDDSRLETSNVLWEFSTDSGTHWTAYFAMPNKPYTRVSLPSKTNQIRVRAQSSTDVEWIRGYSIMPLTSMRGRFGSVGDPEIEEVSLMRWETTYPVNSPIFTYEDTDGNEVRTRRTALPQGSEFTLGDIGDISMTYLR